MTELEKNTRRAVRNRWTLLILLATFVVPFVIGHLAYTRGWYSGGQTNKGDLMMPPVEFLSLGAAQSGVPLDKAFLDGKWWLVYIMPAECGQACRNSFMQMQQVRKAAGREAERVRLLVLSRAPLDAAMTAWLDKSMEGEAMALMQPATVNAAFGRAVDQAADAGRIYIMDPMGFLMLSYPAVADEKQALVRGEDILEDLRKLLKASRIG